jgi:SAM-dependent methyltransferase
MVSTFTATDGDAYEQQMGRWSQRLAEPFLDFTGPIGTESILDLGCGTGSLTLALARRSAASRVCGLDVSAAYIDYARRRTSDPQIDFRVGDACTVPFSQASFDRVLSLRMLHFVPAAPAAVARGGVVAHRIFLDTAAALDPQADALRARNCTRPMTRSGELAAAWQEAGFQDIAEATLTFRMDYADFKDFWRPYLGRQGPAADYVAGLGPAALSRLREHVHRAYLDGEPDGPRSYAATAWAVRGIAPG